jgi:alpha-ribazole phosphatase
LAKLLLVRHGQTEYNNSFMFAGSIDSPLTPAGQQQTELLRDRLAKEKIDAAVSSTMKRAMKTASTIIDGRNIKLTTYPELREMNYGKIEGMTFGEIHHCYPDVAASIEKHDCKVSFPGGEFFIDLETRTAKIAEELKSYPKEQTILVVAHGGPLRMLICKLLETEIELWWKLRIDNASLSIVDTYPEGAILSLLNDISHLSGKAG